MAEDCIFCKIIAGEISSDTIYSDELVTAFRDINPQAPTHILIVPNQHTTSLSEMGNGDGQVLGRIVTVANQLAAQEGIADSGYRLITNIGPDAGQAVFHTHFHLLGGRHLGRLVRPS